MIKLNCLIVDDEPIARNLLEGYIGRIPEVLLVKKCKNATEAYEALHETSIDLIFLDIQMPTITGTEFLRSLRRPPLVVFTTAFANFAVEGFELNSVDYLLKPITFERFYQAVQKAIDRKTPLHPQPMPETPDYIFIKQDSKLVRIDHADIDFLRAEKDFCWIFCGGEVKYFVSMHLKMLEEMLPANKFQRIHRSYLVNLSKIKALKGNTLALRSEEIPIGANYRQLLMEKLGL
ncbi:LytR/AlgR family response regulator transcription factor [Pedobacter chinensis]|uniref:LytR/AlgR family response regulator transcription factor n=1 Tax=Pedobacter chinensis TaxID=2282421 RepID=UPI001F4731AB|nr:LytTR family DNA-binding domain-containing protein [Pedobacter chinensis]